MQNKLSAKNRAKLLKQAIQQQYDVIIIGGGITGAGIALDATTRQLNCILFEMQDFAAGTSSRSTKLIHGGLRYLKNLEVRLVREVGSERAILHKNAPHIVVPRKMLLPIIKEGSLGKYSTSMGLYVYDLLAGVIRSERRKMLNKKKTLIREPLLREDIVLGGGLYYEYQTDDARLVIETLKTAINKGASAFNYVEVKEYIYDEKGKAIGVKIIDHIENQIFEVFAKKIVNATGPWVDGLRKKDNSLNEKRLHLTKGVHIVVPYNRLPLQQAAYFDTQDRRMIFAIPKGNITYIGTTDNNYTGQIERPQVNKEDAEYIIDNVNRMFPTVNIVLKDIISSWAGLRPLIHEEGKAPSELSRKDEIFYADSGVITIAGGKLTGFRKMAERTVDVVEKALCEEEDRPVHGVATLNIVLGGGDFKSSKKIKKYIKSLSGKYDSKGITLEQISKLVYKYGRNIINILFIFEDEFIAEYNIHQNLLLAELKYGIKYEAVNNLCDFLIRRSGMLYFERKEIENIYPVLLEELANSLGFEEIKKQAYLQEFETEYKAVLGFLDRD